MEQIITSIAEHIENWTIAFVGSSPDLTVKNWGFVELANRTSKGTTKHRYSSETTSNQPIPMTINGTGERLQVSLDDQYQFIEWIRWTAPATAVITDEDSWGLKEGKRKTLPLRIVIAHRVELGEDLIFEIAENLPQIITLTGYDFIFLQGWSVDPSHEQIYVTELGQTAYEKHRFDWNIYTIDLNVEFKKCIEFVSSSEFITDDLGDCLTVN